MKHPSHVMHDNSLAAYRSEQPKLSRREQAIVDWITTAGPRTDREVATALGFGNDLNAVRPRITELIDDNRLMQVCTVTCPVTRKAVRKVDIRRPRQEALFS